MGTSTSSAPRSRARADRGRPLDRSRRTAVVPRRLLRPRPRRDRRPRARPPSSSRSRAGAVRRRRSATTRSSRIGKRMFGSTPSLHDDAHLRASCWRICEEARRATRPDSPTSTWTWLRGLPMLALDEGQLPRARRQPRLPRVGRHDRGDQRGRSRVDASSEIVDWWTLVATADRALRLSRAATASTAARHDAGHPRRSSASSHGHSIAADARRSALHRHHGGLLVRRAGWRSASTAASTMGGPCLLTRLA